MKIPRAFKTTVKIIGVLLVLAAIAVIVAVTWFFTGLCGETVKGIYPSPAGDRILTVYERDCGATTGFMTHVSIQSRLMSKLPIGKGEIVASIQNNDPVKVEWLNENEVILGYNREDEFFHKGQWKTVKILRVDLIK